MSARNFLTNRSRLLPSLSIASLAMVVVGIFASRGWFIRIFNEFDVTAANYPFVALSLWLPVLLAAVLVLTVAKEWLWPGRVVAYWWNLLVLVGAYGCLTAYLISVLHAWFTVIQRLAATNAM